MCHGAVKGSFSAKAYLLWFAPLLAVASGAFYFKQVQVAAGVFVAAILVALLASVQLEDDAV